MDTPDRQNIPEHIAIIMDGNGRWARKRLMNRINGHRKGMDAVKTVVTCCRENGVRYLTLYAFSTENWNRPGEEVKALMMMLGKYLKSELDEMMKNNIRLMAIGNLDEIPENERNILSASIEKTKNNNGMTLILALSYGARDELINAVRMISKKHRDNDLSLEDINEETLSSYLTTSSVPDPDLLIRTSGEMRISNFLLWQIAYTELYFTDKLWPDFGEREVLDAIADYQSRERRYGRTSEQMSQSGEAN